MLFKALIRRLNGGTDTHSTKVSSSHRRSSHLAYQKYPNLPGLILKLLYNGNQPQPRVEMDNDSTSSVMKAQSIFAALEVVEQSGMPPTCTEAVRSAICLYAESPDWSLREKAAKALSLVIDDREIEEESVDLLSLVGRPHNAQHGRLLRLRFLLRRVRAPLTGKMLSM